MGTAQGDQAVAPGCAVEAASQKGLINQIRPQHHPTGTVTDQGDALGRRLALKLAHTGIDTVQQATPAEAPARCQPIQSGCRDDAHWSAGGLMNPISEGAIRLIGNQKTTEDDNRLGEARRAGQDQIVLIT